MDDDVSLPKTTLVKMIRDCLPSEMRMASDASDMLVACCTEFVQLVGSEANSVAVKEGKKTLQPEHVLSALRELGYPDMLPECSSALETFKEETKASNSQKAALRKTGAEIAGLSEAEQIALQQQMFAAARAASLTSAGEAAAIAAAYEQAQAQQRQQQQQQQQQQQVETASGVPSASAVDIDKNHASDDDAAASD